jgi:hypothetical protein
VTCEYNGGREGAHPRSRRYKIYLLIKKKERKKERKNAKSFDRENLPNATVVGGNEYFIFARHRLDTTNFPSRGIFASGRAHVYLRMILKLIRYVEYASAVVGANDREFSILAEIRRGDELRLAVHFVPYGHLLIRNIPKPKLTVERAGKKITIVPRMKYYGRDKIDVLETTEALLA